MVETILLGHDDVALSALHDAAVAAGLTVVGMTTLAGEVAGMAKTRGARVLLCEPQWAGGSTLESVHALRESHGHAELRMLVRSRGMSERLLWAWVRAGIDGWWQHDDELHLALTLALADRAVMGPELARLALDYFRHMSLESPHSIFDELLSPLSLRSQERALLVMLSQGQALEDVAVAQNVAVAVLQQRLRAVCGKAAWMARGDALRLAA